VRRLRSNRRPLEWFAVVPGLPYDRRRQSAAARPTSSRAATWLWISDTARAGLASGDLALMIRTYRAATGTSQRRLAELLGYDPTYISMIENGRREISDVTTRLRIARRLGLPAHTLGVTDPDDADFTAMLQFGESTTRLAANARQSGQGAEAVNELWPLVTRLESRVAGGHVEREVMRLLARARAELDVSLGYVLPGSGWSARPAGPGGRCGWPNSSTTGNYWPSRCGCAATNYIRSDGPPPRLPDCAARRR